MEIIVLWGVGRQDTLVHFVRIHVNCEYSTVFIHISTYSSEYKTEIKIRIYKYKSLVWSYLGYMRTNDHFSSLCASEFHNFLY